MYKIVFEANARKQFYKLSRPVQVRITKAIDEKLVVDPQQYLIPLRGDKSGIHKFRVGDYRLLCIRSDEEVCILIVKVKHRKEVYRD